jgi:hypothetical protein
MTTKKRIMPDDTDSTFSRNPLTDEQAGKIGAWLAVELQDESALAALLLLIHAFTFEPDMTAREGMQNAVEKEVAPLLRAMDNALTAVKRRQLAALKGGAR